MVTIKRIEADHLVFTSALWTRKAEELEGNKRLSLLFYWPELGRQVHLAGTAAPAPRPLAEALFRERELAHQIQTHVSRQGQRIKDLGPLRHVAENLYHRLRVPKPWPSANADSGPIDGAELTCPSDWGAYRVWPEAIEFWVEAADRLHLRMLYELDAGERWQVSQLAP
jgi:pyridoxamine 5'-phosphate oxidase